MFIRTIIIVQLRIIGLDYVFAKEKTPIQSIQIQHLLFFK